MSAEVRSVRVELASASYDVTIGGGLLDRCGEIVAGVWPRRSVALVTDETVFPMHCARVRESLALDGFTVTEFVIPAGEASKSWEQAGDLLERLASAGIDRTGAVLALGGGVVGDLAGFVAATYLRGVSFAQMPTTLLAQVDSSVGGKTGVDLRAGKNLAGAFIQPDAVVADIDVLATLPDREWRSGLAEVAKSAVLDSERSLRALEESAEALVSRDTGATADAVEMCVSFKARVVASDERESGPRECLNLGHTLGHAIENVAGYGAVPHGLAVAEGMRFAADLAVRAQVSAPEFAERQHTLLDRLGLTPLPKVYDWRAIARAMTADKKARAGRPRFVLATAPGEHVVMHVSDAMLADALRDWSR